MPETWTTQRILGWTAEYFQRKGVDSPRLSAEVLLAHVLGCDRVKLYMDFTRPLDKEELARYRSLVERRASGEPAQYLVGEREFFGRPFHVDSRVLAPRPETELVVERCLAAIPAEGDLDILDLCTGSGCVAVTLAAERPLARVVAAEVSPGALEVAKKNAERHGVASRVELVLGDLFVPVSGKRFDVVCSNPPYVASGEIPRLQREIRDFEPRLALDGGPDGLDVLRRIAADVPAHLERDGFLCVEIGETQGKAVADLFASAGLAQVEIHRDYARHDRVVTARSGSPATDSKPA